MHCIVSGRVQGVCFRAGARQCALRLGLTGWVRNLPDGSVETRAFGAVAALQEYRQWLCSGTPAAQVSGLDCQPCEIEVHENFVIRC